MRRRHRDHRTGSARPLTEPGDWRDDVGRCELLHRLVGVRAHLPDPAPAQDGPGHGRPCLGARITSPRRVLIVSAIGHVGPPLGLGRPPRISGDECDLADDRRVSRHPTPLIEPPEPALQGGEPALPVSRRPQILQEAGHRVEVPRRRWRIPALPRLGRSAGTSPLRVPAAPASARAASVPAPPGACPGTGGGRAGQLQHRVAQRSAHPLQYRGLGQEHLVGLGPRAMSVGTAWLAASPLRARGRAGPWPCRAAPPRCPRSPRRAAWSRSSPWSARPRAGRTPHSGRPGCRRSTR